MLTELLVLSRPETVNEAALLYSLDLPDGDPDTDDNKWIKCGAVLCFHLGVEVTGIIFILNHNLFREFGDEIAGDEAFRSFVNQMLEVTNNSMHWLSGRSIRSGAGIRVYTPDPSLELSMIYDAVEQRLVHNVEEAHAEQSSY